MSKSLNITAALQQHIGTTSGDLLTLLFQSMDVFNDVTVLPNVKNKIRLTTLMIDNIVKPFSATFSATANAINFIPREIGVDVGKAELEIIPEEYRQTYLAEFMKPGVARTPEDLPFEQYVWEQIILKFAEELNNATAYHGVKNAAGTSAVDVTNGFGKQLADMITANQVTPNAIGALDPTTAGEQLKALWRSIPEKFRVKSMNLKAYMSLDSYEAYEDFLDTKQWNVGRGDDYLGPKYLRGTSGMLELVPASWMAGSERVIITPKQNIILAADATEFDMGKINIVQDVWSAKIGIAAALGFDFRYGGLTWCNEVA